MSSARIATKKKIFLFSTEIDCTLHPIFTPKKSPPLNLIHQKHNYKHLFTKTVQNNFRFATKNNSCLLYIDLYCGIYNGHIVTCSSISTSLHHISISIYKSSIKASKGSNQQHYVIPINIDSSLCDAPKRPKLTFITYQPIVNCQDGRILFERLTLLCFSLIITTKFELLAFIMIEVFCLKFFFCLIFYFYFCNTKITRISYECVCFISFYLVHPVINVRNQLVGSPFDKDVTIECNVEASPKSINYWIKDTGKLSLFQHNNSMFP